MSAASSVEQLYCANCSDPVEAVDEDGRGRCCRNLPNPWHRGGDGLYTQRSRSADAEQEDDGEADERPRCPHCGGRHFRIDATEWRRVELSLSVSGSDNDDLDDSTLWYDREAMSDDGIDDWGEFSIRGVVCSGCHQDVSARLTVDAL